MTLEVYDFRTDIRNVLITPEIRARFFYLEPGEVASRHSHDLGHEVFLVLQGKAEFDIEGDAAVLEPGQMCVALTDELHHVRNVGDEPMILYLSVTPHIEPTHTHWDENGSRKPPIYGTSTAKERAAFATNGTSPAELAARLQAEVSGFASTVQASAATIGTLCTSIQELESSADETQSEAEIDLVWTEVYAIHRALREVQVAWNELAVRCGKGASKD